MIEVMCMGKSAGDNSSVLLTCMLTGAIDSVFADVLKQQEPLL